MVVESISVSKDELDVLKMSPYKETRFDDTLLIEYLFDEVYFLHYNKKTNICDYYFNDIYGNKKINVRIKSNEGTIYKQTELRMLLLSDGIEYLEITIFNDLKQEKIIYKN